ncbi:MFS general substrate transporter [Mycena crocata]|nr:MFS general substrate transporter [Mycena crocata]
MPNGTEPESPSAPVKRTPIPKLQVFILLSIQFSEPITALVIYPFVVQCVRDTGITGGDETKTGSYAGLLESTFFVAESLTIFQVSRLSDTYGRRPMLLLGTLGLGISMLGFGLSKSFWMLLFFRCAQGAFNGNMGVTKTVANEISDPSNAADIFSYSPITWTIGATLAPFLGGFLADAAIKWPETLGKLSLVQEYPYFLPCAAAACVAFVSFIFALVMLPETLPSIVARKRRKLACSATETDPLLTREHMSAVETDTVVPLRDLMTPTVVIAVLNHGMLALCDMGYLVLLPLVYATPISLGGVGLKPHDIGFILGISGVCNAFIQIFFAGRIIRYFGPRGIFIGAFCGFIVAFSLYPLLSILAKRSGGVDGAVFLVIACQLSCSILTTLSFVSTLIFVMDAAPNRACIGAVYGLAQTVGSMLRCITPYLASSLFSLSVKHNLINGYMVYLVMVLLALGAVRCSWLLPHQLQSEKHYST